MRKLISPLKCGEFDDFLEILVANGADCPYRGACRFTGDRTEMYIHLSTT
jgi:hypothetical protein